jgi:hypothetical protein
LLDAMPPDMYAGFHLVGRRQRDIGEGWRAGRLNPAAGDAAKASVKIESRQRQRCACNEKRR